MNTLRAFLLRRRARKLLIGYCLKLDSLGMEHPQAEEVCPSLAKLRRKAKAALVCAARLEGKSLRWN